MVEFFTNNFWTITFVAVGFWLLTTILEKVVTKKRSKVEKVVDKDVEVEKSV